MKKYFFFHLDGRSCTAEANPFRPETWPYLREEIGKVLFDCTEQFLSHPVCLLNRRELEKLRELLDCIDARYKEKLSLEFALEKMGMGKSRFSAFFRNQTGMSLVAYINKVRIEQAARLLIETNRKSEAVGFDCGFDSPSHFYKCFKERYGISPAQFKSVAVESDHSSL